MRKPSVPGPWHVSPGGSPVARTILLPSGFPVAVVFRSAASRDYDTDATAELAAAAPELRDLLAECAEVLLRPWCDTPCDHEAGQCVCAERDLLTRVSDLLLRLEEGPEA